MSRLLAPLVAPLLAPLRRAGGRFDGWVRTFARRQEATVSVELITRLSDEPPAEVSSEIMWRVAARLFREHQPDRFRPPDPMAFAPLTGGLACVACRRPWPCSGLRMAELGLSAAKG